MHAIPGDIIDALQAEPGNEEIDRAALEKFMGLDVPLIVQYGRWIGIIRNIDGEYKGILNGYLGYSWIKKVSVNRLFRTSWAMTLELSIIGFVVSIFLAIPIGIYSATKQGKIGDILSRSFAIFCISVPSFWLATMIIVYPAIWWGYTPPLMVVRFRDAPIDNLKMFIIPGILLGMQFCGMIMRITRTKMLDVLRQDYIRTARSKGLSQKIILVRHALKNALILVITLIGQNIPFLIGGTIIIEEIFSIPGMGRLLINAFRSRDNELTGGIILFYTIIVLIVNLIVDLSYSYINPKIRYESK